MMHRPRATESHFESFGILKEESNSGVRHTAKRIVLVERPQSQNSTACGKKHVPEPAHNPIPSRRRSFSSDSACRTDSVSAVLTLNEKPLALAPTPRERTAERIFPDENATAAVTPARGRSQYSWATGSGNITDWERPVSAGVGSGRRSFTPQPTSPEFDLRAIISCKRRVDVPGQRDFSTVLQGVDDNEPTFRPAIRSKQQCIQKARDDPETPLTKRRPSKRLAPATSTFADTKKIFMPADSVTPAAAPPARQEPLIACRTRTGRKFVSQPDQNQGVSRKKHIHVPETSAA
jgi:hypothetical protein